VRAPRIQRRAFVALLAGVGCLLWALAPPALARPNEGGVTGAGAARGRTGKAQPAGPATAPNSPPLSTGGLGGANADGGEEAAGGTPQTEADPLVSNGLGSPSCRGALASELSVAGRRDCETSGFAAAPAPTADYGIDVHIDNSVLNPNSWGATIVQGLFVTPLWMGLVWAVHALVVTVVKLDL
jgi:hypothetical protein